MRWHTLAKQKISHQGIDTIRSPATPPSHSFTSPSVRVPALASLLQLCPNFAPESFTPEAVHLRSSAHAALEDCAWSQGQRISHGAFQVLPALMLPEPAWGLLGPGLLHLLSCMS